MTTPATAEGTPASADERGRECGRVAAVLLSAIRAESQRLEAEIERQAIDADTEMEKLVLQRIQDRARARRNEPPPVHLPRRFPVMGR